MVINNIENNDKIAIVVVGYNRIKSIQRLLDSLTRAEYPYKTVIPLVISIDCSNNQDLYQYVNDFKWPFGNKYVFIQKERLGLRNHIIRCGDLTQYFRAIILLEDDIFVSSFFYNYAFEALNAYETEDRIAGISLYNKDIGAPIVPVYYCNNGSDTFLRQSPESWGECWSKKQWSNFKEWYISFKDENFEKVDMPDIMKNWSKSWTKYFMAYMIETRRYFVYPYFSLTTCFGDAGEHFESASMMGQTVFLEGRKHYFFKPFEQLEKYDIYCTNENIYDWLNMHKKDVCVDWYGMSKNNRHCRYILSPLELPYKICRSYGLVIRPIELNVKYNISGNGIYLYDTLYKKYNPNGKSFPITFWHYYLSDSGIFMAKKYFFYNMIKSVKKKLSNVIRVIRPW